MTDFLHMGRSDVIPHRPMKMAEDWHPTEDAGEGQGLLTEGRVELRFKG